MLIMGFSWTLVRQHASYQDISIPSIPLCPSATTWPPAGMGMLSSLTRDMMSSGGSSRMSLVTLFTDLGH